MSPNERQRVVRVPGARRAKLTPAPGTDLERREGDGEAPAATTTGTVRDAVAPVITRDEAPADEAGPNDERMRREVPPHY
jgi:hypothetical protein